ncbi:hypothetical protein MMC19_000845 [Ptychographa xylographoides]|nr:hypothetical protein [Ptychographa xylographoides]
MADASGLQPPPLSLLLLAGPPRELTIATVQAAYGPVLTQTLCFVASFPRESGSQASLDIALNYSKISLLTGQSRSTVYDDSQHVIALLYGLICSICTKNSIDLQYDNDIDIRIILIGSNGNQTLPQEPRSISLLQGPVIDLPTLSVSQRPWKHVFSIESEEGEQLLQEYVGIRRAIPPSRLPARFSIKRYAGGLIINQPRVEIPEPIRRNPSGIRHTSVAVGGTFDHIHGGHKLLLTATALVMEPSPTTPDVPERCLTIGITGDELLKNKKYAKELESWDVRQAAVSHFLTAIISFEPSGEVIKESRRLAAKGPYGRSVHHRLGCGLMIKYVEISDPFGPTITEESITALVVSGETRSGGKAVNDKRAEKGWPALEVFEVDVLDVDLPDETTLESKENFQNKLSSTEIRRKLHEKAASKMAA